MTIKTNSAIINSAVLSGLLAVSLLTSCGGGGATGINPNPNPGENPGTPAVGTADLSGQLVQAGGGRVTSAAGDALGGLLVSLINTASGQQSAAQRTSTAGRFEFKGMPSGSQYLMKVEFTSGSDLDGDGRLDEIELYQPLSLGSQAVVDLLSKIGAVDSDDDGQLDALEVETLLSDDSGMSNTLRSQHRRRSGETRRDDDGNGSFDDNPGVRDSDGDGIPDVPVSGGSIGGGSGLFELEVKGSIESISGSSITVSGQTFALTSATTWRIDDNRNADPAQFTVGTFVEVEGIRDGSGGWIATKVKTEDDFGAGGGSGTAGIEREVKGFIEALSADSITVGGITFALTSTTTWRIDDNRNASPSQFSVGMFVEVEGPADGQGGYTATKVKTEDDFGPSGGDDDSGDDNGGDDNGSDDNGGDDKGSDDNGGDDDGSDDDDDEDEDDDDSGSDDDDDDDSGDDD